MDSSSISTEHVPYSSDTQADLIQKSYLHLLGAVAVFVGLEILYFSSGIAQILAPLLSQNWLIVLGGFMVLGFLTSYFSSRSSSPQMQYAELAVTVVLQSLLFIPLLAVAVYLAGPTVLTHAIYTTLGGFAALTFIVLKLKTNFSFLGPFLAITGLAAFAAIIGSLIFGFGLGLYFSLAMVVFAAGTVLYETSKLANTYTPGQHVIAATGLFASVALLFYYVLMLFINRE